MGKLVDYPCKYSEFHGLLTVDPEPLGLSVPELYQKGEDMAAMAKAMKGADETRLCRLPIDTIALAENLGASVIYDTSSTGPRKKEDVIKAAEEVLALPDADPERGRMAEIMKGVRILAEEGETPVFAVKGLFDTMNFLLDLQQVIMDFSMKPDVFQQVSDRIRQDIVRVCLAAEEAGARMFSYEDGSGSLNVIGPRFAKKLVKNFLYPLMLDLVQNLGDDTVVVLCPKAGFMLTGCDMGEFCEKEADPSGSWAENYLRDPGIRLAGSMCTKELGQKASGKLVYIELN